MSFLSVFARLQLSQWVRKRAHSHTNKHLRQIQMSTSGQRARGGKYVAELKMATLTLLRVAAGVALLLQVYARFTHISFAVRVRWVFFSVPMFTELSHCTRMQSVDDRSVPVAVRIQQCSDRFRTESTFAVYILSMISAVLKTLN